MKTVTVRYKTRPDCADENEALIARVFEALAKEKPQGLRYQAMREAGGNVFVHVASIEEGIDHPLLKLPAFQEFQAGIKSRCEEPPLVLQMKLLGRFEPQPR
jgi:hypothetical protein